MPPRLIWSIWVICRKDLQVWLRQKWLTFGTVMLPISYFLVVFLGAQAVSFQPVAVVNQDQGPIGKHIVQAMIDAQEFRIDLVNEQQAQDLYQQLQVAAVITVPANFSHLVQAHAIAPVQVRINNYNLDVTDDLRRAVPQAITVYYQSQGSASPLAVTVAEHYLRPVSVQLFQYSLLPIVIFVTIINGLNTTGLFAANEWEGKTIKELLLAPCGRLAIILGKVLSGVITSVVLALGILAFGAAFGLTRPAGWMYWLSPISVIVLASFVSGGLGVAVGAFFQRKQPVIFVATSISIYAFSLAGGIGVIFFEPEWLQQIAEFDPFTHAIHTLQMAVFYSSFDQFPLDTAVLAGWSIVSIALGVLAMNRKIVVQ
jgi:ABC-2 type transport system permease protein